MSKNLLKKVTQKFKYKSRLFIGIKAYKEDFVRWEEKERLNLQKQHYSNVQDAARQAE